MSLGQDLLQQQRDVVTAGAIHFHERRLSKIRCAAVGKRRGRKQLSATIPCSKDRDIGDGYRGSPHRQRWQAFGLLRRRGHAVAGRHFAPNGLSDASVERAFREPRGHFELC